MALSIGELVGYLRIDDSGVDQGMTGATGRVRSAVGEMGSAADGLDTTLGAAGRRAGEALGDGIAEGGAAGVDRAETEVQSRGKKFGAAAMAIGGAGGAALAGGFAVAAGNAINVDQAQAKLAAQLGGSAEYAGEMGQIAGDLYSQNYGEGLEDVNNAIREVMNSGAVMEDATNEEISSMTAKAMSLGTAFDQDVGDVVKQVGQLMRNGLASDANEAFDVITRGFQQGVNKADDFLPVIEEYGPIFKQMGLSAADATGLMSQGLKAGARDADITADAVKEFALIAVDATGSAGDGYKTLGLDAQKMAGMVAAGGPSAKQALQMTLDGLRNIENPTLRAATAVQLFGTKAEDMQQSLFALDPSTAADGLGDVEGAAAKLDATLSDTASGKITALQRQFEMWSASLVTTEGPIGTLAAGASAFGPAAIGMAGSLSMVAMAAGPVLASIWSMISTGAVWVAQTAMQGAMVVARTIATAAVLVAQWVIMAAGAMARAVVMAAAWIVAMGPVGWIIATVVGLVALIIANWDTVTAWTASAWAAVTGAVAAAWEWIKSAVAAGADFIVGLVTGLVDLITAPWRAMWALFTGDTEGAWQIINDATGGALDFLGGQVSDGVQAVTDFFVNGWRMLVSATVTGAQNVVREAGALPGKVLSAVGNLGGLLLGAGRDIVMGLWNGILGMGAWLSDMIMGWVRNVVPGPVLDVLGIASPSRYFRDEIGRMIPEGLAGGIIASGQVAADAARAMAVDVADEAKGATTSAMAQAAQLDLGAATADQWSQLRGVGGMRPRGGDGAEALYAPPPATDQRESSSIEITVNNPLAESASDSLNRRARTLAALGLGG